MRKKSIEVFLARHLQELLESDGGPLQQFPGRIHFRLHSGLR